MLDSRVWGRQRWVESVLLLAAQAQIDFPDFCLLLCAVLHMSKKIVHVPMYPMLPWVFSFIMFFIMFCVGFAWQDFHRWIGYRSGFCEKRPEACSVSEGANAMQLQGGPTTIQGWALQQWWQHLWDNGDKKEGGNAQQQLQSAKRGVRICGEKSHEGGEEVLQALELRRE